MKKPEEIKKGLDCCQTTVRCNICPYTDVGNIVAECSGRLAGDALEYIIQLESRLAQVERERNAAVKDLADACKYCKHISCDDEDENSPCKDCMQRKGGVPFAPMIRTRFEWRGVCEENTKGE